MRTRKRRLGKSVWGVILIVCGIGFFYLPVGPLDGHMDEPQWAIFFMLGFFPAGVALLYGLWLILISANEAVARHRRKNTGPDRPDGSN